MYVDTTVVSYLTARPSRDVVVAGHQQSTRDWWDNEAARFELVASQVVVDEASAGDPTAARDRLDALRSVSLLDSTEDAEALARSLMASGAVPRNAADDAAHIAIAVVNGVDYLLTWNQRHIANTTMLARIETVCREAGFQPVAICSPEELTEIHHGV